MRQCCGRPEINPRRGGGRTFLGGKAFISFQRSSPLSRQSKELSELGPDLGQSCVPPAVPPHLLEPQR
ncbi:unnamed protein product [Gadus morhua 'NCC']